MKFVQTLYTPGTAEELLVNPHGWYAPEYHLMSWALSAHLIRQHYSRLELSCNNSAAQVLVQELDLPYTAVETRLDGLRLLHSQLWAWPKLMTYGAQDEPFLHVDGDVFLFAPISKTLLRQPLIAQNQEVATEYYNSLQNELMERSFYLPEAVDTDFNRPEPIRAVNAGILGGNDLPFFEIYVAEADQYIRRNVNRLAEIDVNKFNVFFEQHLFYALAVSQNRFIGYYFEEPFEDNQYHGLGSFWETPHTRQYLHLIGGYKRNQYFCGQMAACLRSRWPEGYYRIVDLFRRHGQRLRLDYYYRLGTSSIKTYADFAEKSGRIYQEKNLGQRDDHPEDYPLYRDMLAHAQRIIENENVRCLAPNDQIITKKELARDFRTFLEKLSLSFDAFRQFPESYLYGKDLAAQKWFQQSFGQDGTALIICNEVAIIETDYDWSLCFQQALANEAVSPYEELIFKKNRYYALVVAEAYQGGYSISELDEFQVQLLGHLYKEQTLDEVCLVMKDCFDEEVWTQHYDEIRRFLRVQLEHLVLLKAVQPAQTSC